MAHESENRDLDARVQQLEVAMEELRRRLDALEREAGMVEEEIRELNEAEDIGVTE